MARSIDFNETGMSAHKLIITTPGFNVLRQLVSRVQLQGRGYAFTPMREPRHITVECAVTGTSLADLDSNLDDIREVLTLLVPAKLIFDSLPLRYYNAILESFVGEYVHGTLFQGTLAFVCPDPLGYSTALTESPHHGITGTETKTETTTGTGFINPIYELIAGGNLDTTIKLENVTTDEELQWTGVLNNGEKLTVDVANWIVRKGVDAAMTITGQFPRLKPGNNSIKVTSFMGDLDITYRNTYL